MKACLHRFIRWYLRCRCGGGARDGVADGGYLLWLSAHRYHVASMFVDVTDDEFCDLRDRLYELRGWGVDYE